MKRQSQQSNSIINRRARYDYDLDEEIIVGVVLTGAETKAARMGHVQLKGSYVTIKNNELYLVNASFSLPAQHKSESRSIDTRDRKLLAHRKQIEKLIESKKNGLTIVPLKLLASGRFIKLVIATGRGKKQYDKRNTIKKRDIERDIARNNK